MARVTAYVPDGLWERAEAVSDQINVSQVFQAALKRELRKYRFREEDDRRIEHQVDLEALRSRLSRERAELYRRGFTRGITCIKKLSYADFRFFEIQGWEVGKLIPQLVSMVDEGLVYEAASLAEESSGVTGQLLHLEGVGDDGTGTFAGVVEEYKQGYVDAIRRVWELVADDVQFGPSDDAPPEEHGRHRAGRPAGRSAAEKRDERRRLG